MPPLERPETELFVTDSLKNCLGRDPCNILREPFPSRLGSEPSCLEKGGLRVISEGSERLPRSDTRGEINSLLIVPLGSHVGNLADVSRARSGTRFNYAVPFLA